VSNIWQQRSQNNNHCTWRDIFTEYWILEIPQVSENSHM